MSSRSAYYRRLQRIRINNVLRESPYLQPFIRISSKWPSQVAPRNHRFIVHPSHSTLHQDHDTSHHSITDDHTDDVPSPSIPNVADLHPNTHPDVLHLHLELSDPPGAPSSSTVPLVSSSQPLAPPNEPVALTETPSSSIVLPVPTSIADASVSKYLNTLKIPEGLYEMWTIIRKNGAPNVMMGDILQWHRQEQLKLASTISLQGIPDHIRLPLDYRGAQKLLQMSSVFHVDVFCLCRVCTIWKPRSLFKKPFTVPCCLLLPNVYDDHFIVYQIHEILQLLLPYYKSRIQIGHYKGYSRLEELRQTVEATDDDVFISIGFDGVPFSPSSGISIYPVLATIDGLNGRHTKGSTFIIALWMGSLTTSKPDVHKVFAPIISQLKVLAATPMKWLDHDGSTKHSRVFVSTILTDTVARPTVQCLTQFNGFYGCGWCLHERDRQRMWDYVEPDLQAPKRTNSSLRALLDQFYNDRGEALSPGIELPEGIQGRTPFADLHYMDLIKDFPPCTMHANYEGVAKTLLHYWCFTPRDRIIPLPKQHELNDILTTLKPPNRITRPPRLLSKMKKAHEFCVWLLYVAPILLQDYLPSELYDHFMTLVRGLSLLHTKHPTPEDINTAEEELTNFLQHYSTHYGSLNGHYNIHILLHLCDFVRERGPLYTYSLMPMESYNGHIKELPTGPKYVTMQMATRFLEETVFKSKHQSIPQQELPLNLVGLDRHLVTKCSVYDVKQFLISNFGVHTSYFQRLRFGRRVFHSLSYSAPTTTNSSCFKIGEGLFFDCHVFVQHSGDFHAVGKKLRGDLYNGTFYLHKCTENNDVCFIRAADLMSVVFRMEYKDCVYIAEFLNDFESYAE